MPIVFLGNTDDDTLGKLTLVYYFFEERITNESDSSERTDTLTYYTSPNNMRVVLKTHSYLGYPLTVDVESWEYNGTVNIGVYSASVVGTSDSYGHDCWECMIGTETFLEYDMDSGILVKYYWVSPEEERMAALMDMEFELPDPYVKDEGVLLAGIFVELAVIIWLLGERLMKPK